MWGINLFSIVSVVFLAYIGHSIWTLYALFFPATCDASEPSKSCLRPALFDSSDRLPLVQLRFLTSARGSSGGDEILRLDEVDLMAAEGLEKTLQIPLPASTRRNGSLQAEAILLPSGHKGHPSTAAWHLRQAAAITTHIVPQAATFQLTGGSTGNSSSSGKEAEDASKSSSSSSSRRVPVTHLRSVVTLNAVTTPLAFPWKAIPGEIHHLLSLFEGSREYLPIFYLNQLAFRVKDLVEVKEDSASMNLTLRYEPISIGKLRLMITALHSLEQLRSLGFSEKDVDEVKGIFADTNFYFLALTFAVAAVHLLLDFLAFKNDIQFWRGRKTMVGLSSRAVLWRAFSQTVIFFYLMDEETSLLVLIPAGAGTLIEFWKVKKAFKVSLSNGWRLSLGEKSSEEAETEAIDGEGMSYLAYILVPLCLGGAVYSLLYTPHKSWYSWFIQSLANGVYAFGFLFMLPQLFLNYRLKSVAHLPWRAFMYKAFNTFIDDLFAFIISMPTAHRLACFRDDIVFLVYLYQRYLYPVDRTRVNEFGESFQDDEKESSKPAQRNQRKETKKNK